MEKKLSVALSKCMALCSKAEKCTFDMMKKLSDWEISPDDAKKIIDELKTQRFIDDKRFAHIYARDKFNFSHWGKVKIAFQLRHKNIPDSIIFDAIDGIDDETYFEKLKTMLEQKASKIKAQTDYEKKAKLIRFAQSRGFEYEIIAKALS
ncbi:MAG: RecX family transcriptional regulator [Prolixibacteraceae bacterium]|nr:RecX family transcriptional regulator [Prolixibacteraceae bacterium]